MSFVHSPVLLTEVMTYLVRDRDLMFLDCTVGEGGHSETVLNNNSGITVVGLDRDKEILSVAQSRLSAFDGRFVPVNCNFIDFANEIANIDELKQKLSDNGGFDSILIDLGISVFHYKISQKGFSFAVDQPLDMRLSAYGVSAADIINNFPEQKIVDIFFKYGEERFSRLITRRIIENRQKSPILTTKQLADIIEKAIPRKFHGKIHPATKCFQALRIVVNNELENIEKGIPALMSLLKKGGRLGVITFHSLEDRIVKNIFAEMFKDCICPPEIQRCICNKKREIDYIAKKISPSDEEIKKNPPSRSAKLRVVEKL